MASLRPIQNAHKCQIDCNNHDQVINALELKSKDLYYFWRNYEWLYARYMSEQKTVKEVVHANNDEQYERQIERLQSEKEQLKKQNKSLKMALQNYKKQIEDLESNNKYESEYKVRINSLNSKNSELQSIVEKQLKEINKLKESIRNQEQQNQHEKNNLNKQLKKNRQTIVQLQQSIDQIRQKTNLTTNHHKPETISQKDIQELRYRQVNVVSSRFNLIWQQSQKLLSAECDSMKKQFQERFQQIILQLTQRQLQSIIQIIQE